MQNRGSGGAYDSHHPESSDNTDKTAVGRVGKQPQGSPGGQELCADGSEERMPGAEFQVAGMEEASEERGGTTIIRLISSVTYSYFEYFPTRSLPSGSQPFKSWSPPRRDSTESY